MSFFELISMQCSMFVMMLVGLLLKKIGLLDSNGKTTLTDLCIFLILPCNIIQGCLIEFDISILKNCGMTLLAAAAVQLFSQLFNRVLYNRYPDRQKKVLQYATLVSNGGFLGNPIAEGIYGGIGVLYTNFYLIPQRIMMWSVGTGYFVSEETDKKKLVKKVLTHPCLVAVYIGLVLMIFQIQLPSVIGRPIRYIGSCNTAVTMLIVGMILADVKLTTIVSKTTLFYSFIRLIVLPALIWGFCLLVRMDPVSTGVTVLLTGMPGGATTAILAAKYDSDAVFATKCVVLSTLLSMITSPVMVYLATHLAV